MTDINQIIEECDEIKALLEKSDMGYHFAASLFRLALQQPSDSSCRDAAETYMNVMRGNSEQQKHH